MAMIETGSRVGPFDTRIDEDFIRRYADATGDPNPRYREGVAVPPLAIAARIFEAQGAAWQHLIPPAVRDPATGGVHGEHDVVLHRPIVPGEDLTTFVEAFAARPFKNNARIVCRYATLDGRGEPVAEQFWTTILFGTTCEPAGPEPVGHPFPEEARSRPVAEKVVHLDAEMARRYAEVSTDFSAHHFDVAAARRSGFDAVFLHGLCTMGLCAQAAVERVAGGDPDRVRRVAARFSSPAFLDRDLVVHLYQADACSYPFEADCAGAKVIGHGRVELRAAS
jgi:acyl dehydratase